MPQDKVVPTSEAVARFVPDGASVCMGKALEGLIPFAAGHELIRQNRRDLTPIGPSSDTLFGQLAAEEIWRGDRILSDPGLVLAPALRVAAVVHEPFGAADWTGFLSMLGPVGRGTVRCKTPRLSQPSDFGA